MKFKKLIALFLIISMIFNSFFPMIAYAMELNELENYETIPMDNKENLGSIEVETHLVLPIRNREENNIIFKITNSLNKSVSINLNNITSSKDGYYTKSFDLDGQMIRLVATKRDKDGHLLSGVDYQNNIVYLSINIYDLKQDTYEIELSGKNFVTYKTNVTLDDYSKRVNITNETGLFAIGDINGDEKVDSIDEELMLEAINQKDNKYDLNLDGVTDIADLNYITAILNGSKKEVKIENTSAIISSENISFTLPNNSLADNSSDLSSIFIDEGVVSLKPSKDGEISEDNPINLSIDLAGKDAKETVTMSEIRLSSNDLNVPTKMEFVIETDEGIIRKNVTNNDTQDIHYFTDEASADTIVISLGKEVAVKKVTIIITETSTNKLADIAKVEFLNNVKTETKMPDNFYTPKNIKVDTSVSEQLTISFQDVPNVTGYEIKVIGPNMAKSGTIFQTTYNTFTVEDLKNYAVYQIYVQSVNQEWRSGWSEKVEASPEAKRLPPAVDMVVATPTYSGIDFSWKDMDDTKSYNLYYQEVGSEEWLSIKDIQDTKYSLKGLKANTEYLAYLTGNNDLGEGTASQQVKAKTLESGATITPKYRLINDYNSESEKTNHIKNVIYSLGTMKNGDNFAMVDDNYLTYWEESSWQAATHYYNIGYPIIILDKSYKMDEFVLTVPDSYAYSYKTGTYDENASNKNDVLVHYWNGLDKRSDKNKTTVQGILTTKYDENGRKYYVLKLKDPIVADAIQIGLTVANNNPSIQIAEVKFYEYDSLVDDVANLFVDDLRIELKSDVTKDVINDLKERANTKNNGEYNPYRESILADLDYAEKILNDEKINDIITLNPNISNFYNNHLGFAMTISDYQPLGIVARPNDTLTIYVGSTGNVNAEVVYTQYYAEPNAWSKTVSQKLVKGQNIINIDKIGSATDERGGSVYIRFTGTPDKNNPIKIRVSGGTKIPVIDTTLLTTEQEKKEAIQKYLVELEAYNASLETLYANEGLPFNKKISVLASTEIVTRHGLFSVSSIAVEDAINSGCDTLEEKVNRLYESTEAFDEMMLMFYRQKGLVENAENKTDELPAARINIRYMRMFDGAFMYAGGYHIGIEYGSIAGLVEATRQSDNKTGYFGWGISHEIGHQINQSKTVYAEVTNNVYALLAQTSNDKDLSRLEINDIYKQIYSKVTSHTLGRAQNVFVQLGMYWQLHLAYDNNKTFTDKDSIYAKINRLSRTYDNKDNYNKDDLLILFASEAANKNLLDFFETWGLKATDKMTSLIESMNLEKETKAIYYLNDAARRYRLNNGEKLSDNVEVKASLSETNNQDKRVTINFEVTTDSEKILGYEILRNGESIAFVEGNIHSYTDNLGAENNRAYTYEVVAYDYLLNKTAPQKLEEVKISHDGSVKKTNFTIESNVKAKDEIVDYENDLMDYDKLTINNLIDGDEKTFFNGTEKVKTLTLNGSNVNSTTDENNAYVIINLNDKLSISGIKYQAYLTSGKLMANTINKYKIYVSSDKEKWTLVNEGTFDLNAKNNYTNTVYFMKEGTTSKTQLWTYNDVSYVKIESVGNKVGLSGAEIDIIAPPGDNIDVSLTSDNNSTLGVLADDYCYLKDGCSNKDENGETIGIIKKGSVIIKGTYAGSPVFNVLKIMDSQNPEVAYAGYQLLFAELNEDLSVYEVATGTWMYVMTEDEYNQMRQKTSSIRAYLYRVNDAETNEGERLTSTSMAINDLKEYKDLPQIVINDDEVKN